MAPRVKTVAAGRGKAGAGKAPRSGVTPRESKRGGGGGDGAAAAAKRKRTVAGGAPKPESKPRRLHAGTQKWRLAKRLQQFAVEPVIPYAGVHRTAVSMARHITSEWPSNSVDGEAGAKGMRFQRAALRLLHAKIDDEATRLVRLALYLKQNQPQRSRTLTAKDKKKEGTQEDVARRRAELSDAEALAYNTKKTAPSVVVHRNGGTLLLRHVIPAITILATHGVVS